MLRKQDNWRSVLNADPTDWLLEKDDPSVRYFALTNLLEIPEDSAEVRQEKAEIMETGVVPRILSMQKDGGYWGKPQDFYERSKYRGTVWQLIILAELGADGNDERIRKACEFILQYSQDRESGGFSYLGGKDGGEHANVVPCLTGNMVWSLIRLGYLDEMRIQQGIDWIVKYTRFDDKITEAPKGWPYEKRQRCWRRHSCHMGVVKALKALAEIPSGKRSSDIKETIGKGAEYLLKHHIFKRSHNIQRISIPAWLEFGFPLMYNTDVLEVLGILTKLGYRDGRMQEALDLVISKQDERGRWKLESTFNGRFLVNIEQKGKPSKWITLHALMALKRIYAV
ncbi:MAG: hypothetical protein OIN83_08850 [Candidatus Methanoperedens sp.]|nr:hypothetical protein [Candidatus Methanoperedens sp.]